MFCCDVFCSKMLVLSVGVVFYSLNGTAWSTVVSVHVITGQHSSQKRLGIGWRSHHVILLLVTSLIHIDSVALVKSFAIFLFIFIKWLY